MVARQLTRYELEIMDVVWRLGEVTVHDVCANLARPLAYTTVMTSLSLLERKKKVLGRTKRGRAFVYRPLVCARKYLAICWATCATCCLPDRCHRWF